MLASGELPPGSVVTSSCQGWHQHAEHSAQWTGSRRCGCSVAKSLSIWLFVTPRTAGCQAPLSFTILLLYLRGWTGENHRIHENRWCSLEHSQSCCGEGTGNPLQYSCLENPVDGGAWWAAVLGVAQSQTRLKRLGGGSSSSSSSRHTDEFPHRSAMIRFSVFTSLIMYFWKLISSDLCTFYMTNLLAEFSQLQSARNWN